METKKVLLTLPADWYLEVEREAHDRYMNVPDIIRERLGCNGVSRGRPVVSAEEKRRQLEHKAREMIGLVLQEMALNAKGTKLVAGEGVEPQIWCAKRDLAKLGLYDQRTQFLKLQGTPYEDLQPPSPAAPDPSLLKKGVRRG